MRRTPTLTAECRRIWEELTSSNPNDIWLFTKWIAAETGLTREQVRDAIWSPQADPWRQEAYVRLRAKNKAILAW